MTQAHIDLLRQVTDALLEVCDGAQSMDYQGFNKPDSDTVRAHYPDMITIAPLLLKYKGQIEEAGFAFDVVRDAVVAVSGDLPTHNWQEHQLGFGKHAKSTYAEMAADHRGYLSWMVQDFKHDDQRWISANAVLSEKPIPDPKPAPEKPKPDETIHLELLKSGKIGVKAPFSNKARCKELPESRWEKPYWTYPGSAIEVIAAEFQEGEQSAAFRRRLAEARNLVDLSRKTTADIELEHFGNGKDMMPFQHVALLFFRTADGKLFLTDEPGLGKTIQALSIVAAQPDMRPAVIVCPASVKGNWAKEAEAWLETDDTIQIIKTGKVKELDSDIIIINYDILRKWTQELQSIRPQIIVFDESHMLKNPKAARSKAAKELAASIPNRILMTGTPVLGKPSELWNQLKIIDPDQYPDTRFFKWHLQYADAHKIRTGYNTTAWDFSGASNLDELAQSLKHIMLRRTKAQVLPELPAKRRSSVLIPIDNRKEYTRAEKEFRAWLAEYKEADLTDKEGAAEHLVKIGYLRQLAVKGKLKAAVEWINNFLESGEKLVVFATHKATIDRIMSEFPNIAVKIDGSVLSDKRQAIVDSFQDNPNTRMFVGNIKAAGVGITLTAASNVVFLELDWTPALMEQAEDRCHRISQKNSVNVWYLLAEKTIDAMMVDMLEQKRGVVAQITEDKTDLGFNLFDLWGA